MNNKTCFKCGLCLPLSSFYKHKMMADGHLNKCKDCTKKDVGKHRTENIEKVRAYDRERAKLPHRVSMSRETNRKIRSRPHVMAAHNAVSRAVASGSLVRPNKCDRCDCQENIQAHHDDHAKHLDVMWLCQSCHSKRHVELRKDKELKTYIEARQGMK